MEKGPSKKSQMREIGMTNEVISMSSTDKKAKNKILHFRSNKIRTTKYNIFSFLPKALMYQFSRFANVYFLVTAIIQSIPYVSPLNPFSAILPLIFVLGVSIIREGIEDYSRYRTDVHINNSKASIYQDGGWKDVSWKDLYVGDYIQIKSEERFPADIMVLTSSYTKESREPVLLRLLPLMERET